MIRTAALLLLLSLPAAAGTLAGEAAVSIGGAKIEAGARLGAGAKDQLECAESKVQRTVSRCALKAASAPFAKSLGHSVASVTLNLHFQGEVVNLSVELSGVSPESLLGELKARLPGEPRVEYWADDEHLFASYIWVDGKTEVELTEAVKGPAGKAIVYVSSLTGNRPIHPDDQPK